MILYGSKIRGQTLDLEDKCLLEASFSPLKQQDSLDLLTGTLTVNKLKIFKPSIISNPTFAAVLQCMCILVYIYMHILLIFIQFQQESLTIFAFCD